MSLTDLQPHRDGATVVSGPPVARWWAQPLPLVRTGPRFRWCAVRSVLPGCDVLVLVGILAGVGPASLLGLGYAVAVFALLAVEGQHRLRLCQRTSDQVPRIALAGTAPLVLFLLWPPAEGALLLGAATVGALLVARAGLGLALRVARARGLLTEGVVVIGRGTLADRVVSSLDEHPELGLRTKGFLGWMVSDEDIRVPRLGAPEELAAVVARYGITRVIVCFGELPETELVPLLRSCRPLAADVCVVPRLHELGMSVPRGRLDEVWGVPLLPLRHHGRAGALVKRTFDLVAGGLLAVLVAPLLLGLALLVRVLGGREAFFRQLRVSRAGGSVEVVKLRTVAAGAGEAWAVRGAQCTRLGRWLRGTHLDELPQLLMVLRGEMSLVGPRPERPYYAMRFAREIPGYADRHRMPGGMTGWAQVHGLHGDTSIRDRARFDNQYIEYWSLWMDVVIVARTCSIVLIAAVRSLVAGRAAPGGGQR